MRITAQEKNEKFLSENKLKALQNSIGFLDSYEQTKGENDFITVGDGKDELHLSKTQALAMLGAINAQRKKLIAILMK